MGQGIPLGAVVLDASSVRALQLEVLEQFSALCEVEGYRWWLCAGTLLGAVRHGGFIPWDDDIDVAMPRDDFDRFCADSIAVPSGMALASLRTDPDYPFPYGKFYVADTRVVEHYDPMPTYGVGIDIFPVDAWPGTERGRSVLSALLRLFRGMLGVRIVEADTLGTRLDRLVARVGRRVLRPFPPAVFARAVTWVVRRTATGDLRGVIVWGYEEKAPARAFAHDTALDFEGIARPAPSGWEEWLTAAYGDYRTPPPRDQQVGHPHTAAYRLPPNAVASGPRFPGS